MKTLISVLIVVQTILHCYAPPVAKNGKENSVENNSDLMNFLHYKKYLKEVLDVLESDPNFKKKIEEANEDDIKSGKIAHELNFVDHHIRTQLDELKRVELARLLDLKHQLLQPGVDKNSIVGEPLHGHLDHSNERTFEIEDLKKLIAKTTQDLAEADKRRRKDFKEYEIEKEIKRREQLNEIDDLDERSKLEKQFKEKKEKHKKNRRLHEPGHKEQLNEVWNEQDHQVDKFNPKVFFAIHDTNSDKVWDQYEVEAIIVEELDKIYQTDAPDYDPQERAEEKERMREAIFLQIDLDQDGVITEQEFITYTETREFQQDHGWKAVDEQPEFTEEELQDRIRQRQMLQPSPAEYYMPPDTKYPTPGQYNQGQHPQQYQRQQSPGHQQAGKPPHYQQVRNSPPPPAQYYQAAPSSLINQYEQAAVQQPVPGQIHNQPPRQQYYPPVQQVNQPPQYEPIA